MGEGRCFGTKEEWSFFRERLEDKPLRLERIQTEEDILKSGEDISKNIR